MGVYNERPTELAAVYGIDTGAAERASWFAGGLNFKWGYYPGDGLNFGSRIRWGSKLFPKKIEVLTALYHRNDSLYPKESWEITGSMANVLLSLSADFLPSRKAQIAEYLRTDAQKCFCKFPIEDVSVEEYYRLIVKFPRLAAGVIDLNACFLHRKTRLRCNGIGTYVRTTDDNKNFLLAMRARFNGSVRLRRTEGTPVVVDGEPCVAHNEWIWEVGYRDTLTMIEHLRSHLLIADKIVDAFYWEHQHVCKKRYGRR